MEKLTETINSLKVSKTTKEKIIKIAEIEELQIQQVCRRLLTKAIKEYFSKDENIVNQLQKNYKYGVWRSQSNGIFGIILKKSDFSDYSEIDKSQFLGGCKIVKKVDKVELTLDSKTNEHFVIKAMTKILVIPDIGKIDEEYDELLLNEYSCVELRFVPNNWYILSSDGLKISWELSFSN